MNFYFLLMKGKRCIYALIMFRILCRCLNGSFSTNLYYFLTCFLIVAVMYLTPSSEDECTAVVIVFLANKVASSNLSLVIFGRAFRQFFLLIITITKFSNLIGYHEP